MANPQVIGGRDVPDDAIVRLPGDLKIERGDRVAVIPNHLCPVVNLFDPIDRQVLRTSRRSGGREPGRWRQDSIADLVDELG